MSKHTTKAPRRTFFSSALSILPTPPTASTSTPSRAVLAALSPPDKAVIGKAKQVVPVSLKDDLQPVQESSTSTPKAKVKLVPMANTLMDVRDKMALMRAARAKKQAEKKAVDAEKAAVVQEDPHPLARLRDRNKMKEKEEVMPTPTAAPTVMPKDISRQSTRVEKRQPGSSISIGKSTNIGKTYMEAGFYNQGEGTPHKLVNRILQRHEAEAKLDTSRITLDINRPTFPPLPYDYGFEWFFGQEHDFVLPYNIQQESEGGILDGKRKPAPFQWIRNNTFPERSRYVAPVHAVCRCDPSSRCGDNCINRIMSYLCGRDCPCGDACDNKSLARRKGPMVKIVHTGSCGFGLVAGEDIKEGDFVIDYRGEVISLDTYHERCQTDYASSKNFYALAYDQYEVIDAGMRGNAARFINHSCDPNLEVHKLQTLGDGLEEFEVGMWAKRDIPQGQQLSYDYNFDVGVAEPIPCRCGASNCAGLLGKKRPRDDDKDEREELARAEADAQEKRARETAREIRASRVTEEVPLFAPKKRDRPVESGKKGITIGNRPIPARVKRDLFPTPSSTISSVSPLVETPTPSHTAEDEEEPFVAEPVRFRTSTPAPSQTKAPTPIDDEEARRLKRISGWAEWLRRKAGEKPRTLQEWQEERHARRRGLNWMHRMIGEFGVLPGPSVPGSPGLAVSEELLQERRKELLNAGVSLEPPKVVKKGKPRNPSGPKPKIDVEPVPIPEGIAGPSDLREGHVDPLDYYEARLAVAPTPIIDEDGLPQLNVTAAPSPTIPTEHHSEPAVAAGESKAAETKPTENKAGKKAAIKARNGAPMGWAFVPVPTDPVEPVAEVEVEADGGEHRGRRRRRTADLALESLTAGVDKKRARHSLAVAPRG